MAAAGWPHQPSFYIHKLLLFFSYTHTPPTLFAAPSRVTTLACDTEEACSSHGVEMTLMKA